MYRTRSTSGITLAICLGLVIGLIYLIYDSRGTPVQSVKPTSAPVTVEPLSTATLMPTPTVRPREITDGARFYAPTAGISTPVIESYLTGESWDIRDLGMYAGHLQGTAWMPQTGNIVLAGHVEMGDGRRGVFANLNDLKVGDPLYLTQNDHERIYQVSEVRQVMPDDLSVLYPAPTDVLTLITCTDYDFVQNVYRQRLVVVAERSV